MAEINYGELLVAQVKTLGEQMAKDKSERASADEARKKELDEALAKANARIVELEAKQEQVRRTAIPGLEYGPKGEPDKLSWARLVQVCADPARLSLKEYGLEREAYEYMRKTAINAGTGAGGGFLVPQTMMDGLIPQLRERSIARQIGATVMSGMPKGNSVLAKSKGGITAEHLNTEEEAPGTETVATFDRIELTPRPIAAFVPLTRQMMTQTAISLEAWVRNEIAIQIALLQDQSFFLGTGTGGAPRGVFNHPSIQFETWATNADAGASINHLVNMVLKSREKFALGLSGLGWVAAPKVLFGLARLKDSQLRPIFQSLTDGNVQTLNTPTTVLRYPILDSAQVSTGNKDAERLGFGPWGDAVIAEWGTMEFAMSDQTETNFRKGRATVRGITEYDVGVFHGEAFVHAGSDAATPNIDTDSGAFA